MNKTAKVFLSAIMLYLIGVVSCMCFYYPKQKQTVIPVKEISKTIHSQNQQSEKQIQKLQNEKVLLQKKLLQTKTTINKQNERVQQLEHSVSYLSEMVLSDSSESNSNCIELTYYADSLMYAYQVKDSITQMQFAISDSLQCKQDSIILTLQTSNSFLKSNIDTLLVNQVAFLKQSKKHQRKLAIQTFGNKVMATGLLACTSFITYLQIKHNN